MESIEQIQTKVVVEDKPKRQYKKRAVLDVKLKDNESVVLEKKSRKKVKRVIDPSKMTYLKAFAIWREKHDYSGLSPKKGTKEYDEIMQILNEHKSKQVSVTTDSITSEVAITSEVVQDGSPDL